MKLLRTIGVFSFATLLVVLPACDWFKDSCPGCPKSHNSSHNHTNEPKAKAVAPSDRSEVLMTLGKDKEAKVTADSFNEYKEDFFEAQPQYKQVMAFIPKAEEQLFDSLVNEIMLTEWVAKEGVDKRADYQKDRDKMIKFVDRSLAVKYFQKDHPVKVSQSEVRKYYDENKNNIPELILQAGGIKAKAVMFTDKKAAQAFYEKVKDAKTDLDKTAKSENLEVKDLGLVNDQNYEVDPKVREKLSELKKFPAVELVTINDNSFAVVKAMSKEEAKYIPFDQIQANLEKYLEMQKLAENMNKEIEKLKEKYNVVVNKGYFEQKEKAALEEAKKMAEKQEKEVGQTPAAPMPAPQPVKGA